MSRNNRRGKAYCFAVPGISSFCLSQYPRSANESRLSIIQVCVFFSHDFRLISSLFVDGPSFRTIRWAVLLSLL